MFKKVHLRLTLLFTIVTTLILTIMSVFYLYTSHRSLYKNALLSIQSDINTFTMSFEKNSSVSYDWLLNLQSNYEYLFYLYDNGIPFRFTYDTKTESEQQLIEDTRHYYQNNISTLTSPYTAEHQEFSYEKNGNGYHVSAITIPGEKVSSEIFVIHSLAEIEAQLHTLYYRFGIVIILSIAALFAFSWLYTNKLLKPIQESQEKQTQFIAAASHEIRNPVNTILSALGLVPWVCPQMEVHAIDEDYLYLCGDNLKWHFEEGVLTISGTGDMYDYEKYAEAPWYNYKDTIESAVIEEGVTGIGNKAFLDCTSLISVTIPDSVTKIGYAAFESCGNLPKVTIPEGVTTIEAFTFFGCKKLTSVVISEGTVSIGKCAFVNGVLIDGRDFKGDAVIPEGVRVIAGNAFYSSPEITSMTIPDSVVTIGDGAFTKCTGLVSLTIPEGVTSIGDFAFSVCLSLVSVKLPESLARIGNSAFGSCSNLTSVTLPENLESIDGRAFSNCTSLASVTVINPDCVIFDSNITIPDAAAIYGYAGSTAEEYANKYGRTFVSLSDAPAVKGDINGDGNADLQDAAAVLNLYAVQAAGLPSDKFTEEQIEIADVDGDGKITISDAACVLAYYAQNAAGMNPL